MIINALKWLVRFLETRFPEKVNPASIATKDDIKCVLVSVEAVDIKLGAAVGPLSSDIEALKKQIEILNLRVGLSRPMHSTVLRNIKNG